MIKPRNIDLPTSKISHEKNQVLCSQNNYFDTNQSKGMISALSNIMRTLFWQISLFLMAESCALTQEDCIGETARNIRGPHVKGWDICYRIFLDFEPSYNMGL